MGVNESGERSKLERTSIVLPSELFTEMENAVNHSIVKEHDKITLHVENGKVILIETEAVQTSGGC